MSDIPKIGALNPAAVIRDVSEKLPKLRSLVCVGVYEDSSADIWTSEPFTDLDRSAILLLKFVSDAQEEKHK